MPNDPLTPPSWGSFVIFDFEEAAKYARDGLPLDRKSGRLRTVHVSFDTNVLNLIDRILNKNPSDFGGQVDNFVYFCTMLTLRTLAEHGVPEEGPLPTPLLSLDQLSQEAEGALAMKRLVEDNVGLDFVIETAVQAGNWHTVCEQLDMLRTTFGAVKWDSMRRIIEQAQAGRQVLYNAVIKLNTLPDKALTDEDREQAIWWSEWFNGWHQPTVI
mgnify:FL=1